MGRMRFPPANTEYRIAWWMEAGGADSAGSNRARCASTGIRSSSKKGGSFIGSEAVPVWAIAGASTVALSFRLQRFGGELSVRLFQKDFDGPFGFFQLLLAFARQAHTFFEEFHRFVERKLRALQSSDYFFQPRKRALKIRLFGLLRFFGYWLIHAIPLGPFLAVRTVIGRTAALLHAPDG